MHRLWPAAVLLITTLATAILATGCAGPASTALPQRDGGPYYLALGDSLAQGVQADAAGASVDTRRGYADQLAALLRRREPGLRLVKLGCPGETTTSMIGGRHCPYRAGSQLAAAVNFLRTHAGHVALITIDIGANDQGSCFTEPIAGHAPPCSAGPDPSTAANLGTIMTRLRAAAGHRVTIIGMSYYDPELPEWRSGRADRQVARASDRLALAYDQLLARVYGSVGARVADVSGAFHTTDFTAPAGGPRAGALPRNVTAICRWTWVCAPPPRGPNKHPNTAGYAIIARAFLRADPR
jgi:lysophospholipase L1-like esterase